MTDGALLLPEITYILRQRWLVLTDIHTNKFLDCDPVEHIEGCVQFERLTAPLTHEADLHGCARRLGALHR